MSDHPSYPLRRPRGRPPGGGNGGYVPPRLSLPPADSYSTLPPLDVAAAKARLVEAVTTALPTPGDAPVPEDVFSPVDIPLLSHPVALRSLVWLRFCGLPPEEIAERMSFPVTQIRHALASRVFYDRYIAERASMLARVDDSLRERLVELVMEALETKVRTMRRTSSDNLRNHIASELIYLGREAAQLGRGNASDLLQAIHEQVIQEKTSDGTRVTTQRVTIEGAPQDVAAAMRAHPPAGDNGNPDGATGDRPAPPPVGRSGADDSGNGAA